MAKTTTINTVEYTVRLDTKQLASDLKKANNRIIKSLSNTSSKASNETSKAFDKISKIGTATTALIASTVAKAFSSVTSGIKGFISSAVDISLGFEAGMSKVAAVSNATGDELVEFAFCKRLFLTWSGLFIMFSPFYSSKLIAQISCSGRIAVICNNKLFFEIDFTVIIIFPSVAIIFWAEGFAPFIKFLSII